MDSFIQFVVIVIASAIAGAVVTFLISLIVALVNKDMWKATRGTVLFYDSFFWLITIFLAVVFTTLTYFTWRDYGFSAPFLMGIFFILALMCLVIFLEAAFFRIAYDDYHIFTRSPWRPFRRIPWHSLTGYSWSEINEWHVLETRSQGKIRVSTFLVGLPEFFAVLVDRMGADWAVRVGIIPEEQEKG